MKILHPPTWPKPKGYANGILVEGKQIFVSGQIGWNEECKIVSQEFALQVKQALKNALAILGEAGAKAEHSVRMTWFVKDKKEYLSNLGEIGESYRTVIGKHFPAMTLVQVSDLLEEGAKVEIEVTAVLP